MSKNKKQEKELILKKTSQGPLTMEQAAIILAQFGLAQNERIVQRLVRENKIEAEWKGTVGDRREGKIIREHNLYKYITTQIPAVKDMYDEIIALRKENELLKAKAPKATSKEA